MKKFSRSVSKGGTHLRVQSWTDEDHWVCGCFHAGGSSCRGAGSLSVTLAWTMVRPCGLVLCSACL